MQKLHQEVPTLSKYVAPSSHSGEEISKILVNTFGMAGIVDLPSAAALPEGELIFYQKNHKTLSRTGATFQLTPRLGLSFRYSGHGKNGAEASGRKNHDRSLDLQFNLMRETNALPAVSFGLRDFIGTGWYSSEYIVGTKTVGPIGVTAGLGFGRLAGRNQIANPFSTISGSFKTRPGSDAGLGGTLGNIQWFRGPASPFAGVTYALNDKVTLAAEYSPDLMNREASYLELKSPYNLGASYRWSEHVFLWMRSTFTAQPCHWVPTSTSTRSAPQMEMAESSPPFQCGGGPLREAPGLKPTLPQ